MPDNAISSRWPGTGTGTVFRAYGPPCDTPGHMPGTRSRKQENDMQPLYIALVLFIVLWGLFFNLMSSYASRMDACRGRSGRFFWTLGTSLAITVAIFLLSEVLPRLYGGIMNLF